MLPGHFSENPPFSLSDQIPHPPTAILLPSQPAYHVGLPRILPYPWCLLSVIFHPLPPIQLLGCKSPLIFVAFGVEPDLCPTAKSHCSGPSWRVFCTTFNKCHKPFFFDTRILQNSHRNHQRMFREKSLHPFANQVQLSYMFPDPMNFSSGQSLWCELVKMTTIVPAPGESNWKISGRRHWCKLQTPTWAKARVECGWDQRQRGGRWRHLALACSGLCSNWAHLSEKQAVKSFSGNTVHVHALENLSVMALVQLTSRSPQLLNLGMFVSCF